MEDPLKAGLVKDDREVFKFDVQGKIELIGDMRWRIVALFMIGLNVMFLAAWLYTLNMLRETADRRAGAMKAETAGGLQQTNVLVRRQLFSWKELESPDYEVYVANLRSIGCPEQTIRDIIIADVNSLYSRKLASELVTAEQQWWRSEPDPRIVQAATQKKREIDEERRTLLAELLGPNWEARDLSNLPRPSRQGIALDGPVLGQLPYEVKDLVQEVSLRSDERLQAYLAERQAQGLEPDRLELAKLRQQTREELARVLPPAQLEEFLLRYSQSASNWRSFFGDLQFFGATADEFRAVFRATDAIDQRLELLGGGTDPNTSSARRALQEERENAIRIALGPKRYQEYQLLQDPLYRDAVATANEAGTPEAARTLYQINIAAAEELNSIQANTNLTAQQKELEMRQLELEQMKAATVASGGELPPEPSVQQEPPRRVYTVRPGDTVATLSLIHGLPMNVIRAANPSVNFARLRPGEVITIPRTGPPMPGP